MPPDRSWVLRRQQDERRAINGVDAGGEDFHRAASSQRELQLGAFRAPNPVPLHRQHLLGPLRQCVERGQQFVRVRRDLQDPLFQVAGHHCRAAAPAGAVLHLLVGEDGLIDGAPVDAGTTAVGEAAREHAGEQPLVPVVVLRRARRDLAIPRVADAEPLELALHVLDVRERRYRRRNAALDRRVLSRHAKGIPAERVQHVEAAHPLGARHHVADDVVADVAHVRVPGWVREHLQAVELRLIRIFCRLECARVVPVLLPLPVQILRAVVPHSMIIVQRFPGFRRRAMRPACDRRALSAPAGRRSAFPTKRPRTRGTRRRATRQASSA